MMILGQIPDPSEVVSHANNVSWEAGMLAVIIVAFMSVIIYMIKRQNDSMKEERISAAKLRESDKEEARLREQIAADRESRMAKRIDVLEDQIKADKTTHANTLVGLIERVTLAITAASEQHAATQKTLEALTDTLGEVNGDIKQMCQLLQLSPCLVAGVERGDIRLLDNTGNEIKVQKIPHK